jgi:Domain of unknown function (DUF4365)
LFPQQIIEELLSIAHVQAIAAKVGVSIATFDRLWRKRSYRDHGVDGHFRQITVIENRRYACGYGLDFQLKASINCKIKASHVRYDLESKTYNDLIRRDLSRDTIPCILLLKVLPKDKDSWLSDNGDGIFLGGACYWKHIQGEISSNKESVRIRIPKTQQLTPDTLLRLLDAARNYANNGVWICQ